MPPFCRDLTAQFRVVPKQPRPVAPADFGRMVIDGEKLWLMPRFKLPSMWSQSRFADLARVPLLATTTTPLCGPALQAQALQDSMTTALCSGYFANKTRHL